MLRFLRKYNKILLVTAGSALMVLFLLPQAAQQFGPNPANEVAFRIDGRAYTGKDVMDAQARLNVIQNLERTAGAPFLMGVPIESLEHWMLLVYEARKHGLVASGGVPQDLMADLATRSAQRFRGANPEQTAALQADQRAVIYTALEQQLEEQRDRVGDVSLSRAIAEAYGVRRLMDLFLGFATISTPEAATIALSAMDTALCDLALVDYSETLTEIDTPTDAEIQEHFEKFKDIDARLGAEGIGYRLWDAVSLETMEIDLTQIRALIPVDEIEANKRWRQNKNIYGDSFTAAKPIVESDIRDERLATIVRGLEELGRRELLRDAKQLEDDGNGFKKIPPDWSDRQLSFAHLAELANAEIAKSVTMPEPIAKVTQMLGWSTGADLMQRTMSRAFATVAGESMSLPNIIMSVRELKPDTKTGMQTDVAFGPVVIPRERMVFVRVLDVRPAGPPASVDEVMLRAREDWKRLRARDLIAERAEEIRQTVIAKERVDGLMGPFQRPMIQYGVEVTRTGATMPDNSPATVANTPAMREAIMDLVGSWDPTVPVLSIPIADRVVVQYLPDEFGVGVALVTGRYPVTLEAMRTAIAPLSQRYAVEMYSMGDVDPPFTFERIKERLGYTLPEGRKNRDTDDEEADADSTDG